MKTMKPCNKFILVEPLQYNEGEEDGLFFTTEKQISPYTAVEVISVADDCTLDVLTGVVIIVTTHGLQSVSAGGFEGTVVPENHIISIIECEDEDIFEVEEEE